MMGSHDPQSMKQAEYYRTGRLADDGCTQAIAGPSTTH